MKATTMYNVIAEIHNYNTKTCGNLGISANYLK